jgi:hypothetical protein
MKRDTKLANATDFGADHPDFRLTMIERGDATAPREPRSPPSMSSSAASGPAQWRAVRVPREARPVERSGLTFSHAEHLNPKGIKAPRGDEKLTCASCHEPESSGQHMLPIRMETHCARCHSLRFDEHDPSSNVPHGDLTAAFETLQAHFIRRYLETTRSGESQTSSSARRPGGEAEIMARDEQRRARDWADKQSLLIARELLEERVCNECHRVTRVPGASGFAQWRIEPVRITQDWMPLARFSHLSHGTTPCNKCHAGASASKASSDVLMPKIGVCRECHGGAGDTTRLPSDCGMCHAFHLPGRGLFDGGARQSSQRARSASHVQGG